MTRRSSKHGSGFAALIFMGLGALLLLGAQHLPGLYNTKLPSLTGLLNPNYSSTGPTVTQQPNVVTSISRQPTSNVTANWSGYAANNGNFTTIRGTWTVPRVSSSSYAAADATWIGIGGITSNDLIQTGTQNLVSADGQVQTSAFFELLPDTITPINSLNVSPGDSMTGSISESTPGAWQIKLTDNSNGQSFVTTVEYPSTYSSAEWIEEAPSMGQGEIPLDNFGSLSFTNAAATENGHPLSVSGAGGQIVSLVNADGQALANVSALGNNGSSFTVTRTSTSPFSSGNGSGGVTPFHHSRGYRRFYNSNYF